MSHPTALDQGAHRARRAGFAAGDVVRNRRTGELLTVTGDPATWDPRDYEPAADVTDEPLEPATT